MEIRNLKNNMISKNYYPPHDCMKSYKRLGTLKLYLLYVYEHFENDLKFVILFIRNGIT